MKRRFFSICMALALCLGLLPATALAENYTASEENGVTTYLINGAGYSYIYCTGDAVIIDVTGLDDSAIASAKLYIKVRNEGCTITLRGRAGKTYMVDAWFGYDAGDPGYLPEKIILDDFCTSGEIYINYYNNNNTNTKSSLQIEYQGTTGAEEIQGGNTSTRNHFDLTLTGNGSSTLSVGSLRANTNLTLRGGQITAGEISAGAALNISGCKVTMADEDREIHANNVTVDNSTLRGVKGIYAFATILTPEMDDSSIAIKGSDLELTGGIYNAREITIEDSTVAYTGSYGDVRLGKLFLELEIQDSTVTGATTSDEKSPAIGLDPGSWNTWEGMANATSAAITIDNSKVSAAGGQYGPAIGRGYRDIYAYPAMTITIQNGSDVTAAAQQGAAIGSGAIYGEKKVDTLDIRIEDSTVRASSVSGAGIGSGFSGNGIDINVPTDITISGSSDVAAASESGAGIGAGQKGNINPGTGIPLEFTSGTIGDWGDGADEEVEAGAEAEAGVESLSMTAYSPAARSADDLGVNSGTLTIEGNDAEIQAQSGVIAVSLDVKASQPMMEYTLDDSEEAPAVTTPVNRTGGTDSAPGAPSCDLRPGYRSLAFWPVAEDTYELTYGSGSDPDPLLNANDPYSDTFTVSMEGGALNAFTVIRQQKLGGSVTLDGAENGTAETDTTLTANLNNLTPSGLASDVTCQWYKDGEPISGATERSYTPGETGVYFCAVTGQQRYRGTVNSRAVTVGENVPPAPTAREENITADAITLDVPAGGQTYEYRLVSDGGISWQDSPTFSGLERGTEYSFVQRVKGSGSGAGPVSAAASFTTKPGSPDGSALQIDYFAETAAVADGVSIYKNEGCTEKITLDANSSITDYIGKIVYAKFDDTEADDTTVTAIQIKDRPAAPTLDSSSISTTVSSVSLSSESGVTYALLPASGSEPIETIEGTGGIITFDGLEPDTDYVLKARSEATHNSFKSLQARAEVTTQTPQTIGVTPGENTYVYDGKPHPFQYTVTPGGLSGFKEEYYTAYSGGDFVNLTEEAPTAAGVYGVILSRAADGAYTAFERIYSDGLEITRGTGAETQNVTAKAGVQTVVQIDIDEAKYGAITGYAIGSMDSGSSNLLDGTPTVNDNGELIFVAKATAAGQTIKIPVEVTTDSCLVTVTVTVSVTNKEQATVTVTQENGVYNSLPDPVVAVTDASGAALTGGTTEVQYTGTLANGTSYGPNRSKPAEPGSYTVTVTYEDDNYYGVGAATFTIGKATPNGAPAYTPITASGKTLADAALTAEGGTFNTAGTVKWVDENGADLAGTTEVTANTAYHWLFTPNDTEHFTTLTGTLVPYRVSGGSGGSTRYSVTVEDADNGTVRVSPTRAERGDTVTITVDPDEGYELDELIVTDSSGDEIEVRRLSNGKYTFTMPRSAVTVEAVFTAAAAESTFADVPPDAYYADAVEWAVANGITGGTTATTFSPNNPCTRAHAVTFLWRAAGEPEPETTAMPFTDVAEGAYYYDAVLWAMENGITEGTTPTTFSPNNPCTRAHAMTFLWRAEGKPAPQSAMGFTDVAAGAYYFDAVAWAVENGITNGTSAATFSPYNTCTRAQIVTFIYRYMT